MAECPLKYPSANKLLDVINATNASQITLDQVAFDDPVDNAEGGNTAVKVSAEPTSPWNSFVNVSYDRLDLARYFHFQELYVPVPDTATQQDLICHINHIYGTDFDSTEFDVVPPFTPGSAPVDVKLVAKDTNHAYTGEVVVHISTERLPLSARLVETALKGFIYPADRTGRLDKPVLTRNAPLSWYNAANDNGMGYDLVENGELFLSARVAWNRIGVGNTGREGSTLHENSTMRNAYSWAHIRNGSYIGNIDWRFLIGLSMQGKTLAQVMELYTITVATRSRANSTAAWVVNHGTVPFDLRASTAPANSAWWSNSILVVGDIPRSVDTTNYAVLGSIQSRDWFFKGMALVPSGVGHKTGEVEITITAKRKDGQGVPMVLVYAFRGTELDNSLSNPTYEL